MTRLLEAANPLNDLEAKLRRRHRNRVRNLRLVPVEESVDLYGEAVSFYAKQLVISDLLAHGAVRIRANHIAVD